jgi:23S rRNA pseudoU1915 N3-methylase RlmH
LYRGINVFKKDYQSESNMRKDGKEDLHVGSYGILNACENQFCQLMNVCEVNFTHKNTQLTLSTQAYCV